MQKIKKISTVFIVFLTISTSLFSLNRNIFNMNISSDFGFLTGKVNEYVFTDRSKNTDHMMSRLDWDVVALPYFEGDITIDLFKYLYINANGRIGLSVYSGVMQDYDWLNSTPPSNDYMSWLNDDPTELTNYSKHENEIDKYYTASVKLGGNFILTNNLKLTPFVGYKYDYIGFSAYNGYTKYKWHNFEINQIKGKCISYWQTLSSFIVGVNFNAEFNKKLSLNSYLQVVPSLGELRGNDIHYVKTNEGLFYLDYITKLFQVEGKVSFTYSLDKHNNIGLTSSFLYLPISKGLSGNAPLINGQVPLSVPLNKSANGGARRLLFSFSLIYQFKL